MHLKVSSDYGHNNSGNIGIATGDNNGDNNDNNSSDTNIGEILKWLYKYKRLQIENLSY